MKPDLAAGEAFVPGRSRKTARQLLEKAAKAGVEPSKVRATFGGYIVPKQLADTDPDAQEQDTKFDPAEHDVSEVKAYLQDADEEERQRVLDAERSGKARKSLLPDEEGNED